VELQQAWPELDAAGVAVFGLSYDATKVLAGFAEKRGITFPLLSDEGSHAIRALGLLNEHVAEQHAYYGVAVRDEHHGVPYPGTFVLDENGFLTAKYFEQSYRVRPTAALFREFALGSPGDHPPAAVHADGTLQIRAWTDTPTYRPYQQQRLHVELDVQHGTHVFAAPAPEDYAAMEVDVEPLESLTIGRMESSAPTEHFRVPGVDQDMTVYTGSPRVTLPLLFAKNLGPTPLQINITYQSCTETICFPPRTAQLTVTLEGLDLMRD
jgi:peroxiredoxin